MFGSDEFGLRAGESNQEELDTADTAGTAGRETDPVLLDRLMSLPPGAELELVLAGLDPKRMSAVALIEASKACVRMATHHQAQFHAAVVEAMSVLGDRDLVVSQIAAALRLTRREAEEELDLAMSLNPMSTGDV